MSNVEFFGEGETHPVLSRNGQVAGLVLLDVEAG